MTAKNGDYILSKSGGNFYHGAHYIRTKENKFQTKYRTSVRSF